MQAVPHCADMYSGGDVSVSVVLRVVRALLVPTACSVLLSCGDAPSPERPREHAAECVAPSHVANRPRSIEESVALANALPKPLTLPCYLEALGRPLQLHATLSEFSAQPARGEENPRLFVVYEPLVMTVVPVGIGHELLELGELRPEHRSLKGELRFPLAQPVEPGEVYRHTLFSENLTACAFCHADEVLDSSVPGGLAYVSQALRPRDGQRVSLDALRAELDACDTRAEPDRCAMLDALFGWGDTVDWEFPADMATFGD